MRMPPPTATEPASRRFGARIALIIIAVLLIILLFSARGLAVLYTDKLWFDDLGFGMIEPVAGLQGGQA